ncbi:MAG TPA: hypothetical protein DCR46_08985, partial [Cytophagales bacterium]|nr:hypothetical protein [Cytophagales bacterium]
MNEKRKSTLKNINLKAGFIIFATIVLSSFSFYGYQVLFAPNILLDKQESYLYIPTGGTFESV